ncbi:MAG TPA: DUF1127 domain-containing protein [Stellaceae bacterium]
MRAEDGSCCHVLRMDAPRRTLMISALYHQYGARLRHLPVSALVARARRAVELVACWQRRARERQLLWALDDRALRDIGISRVDAARECGKPFWRA